MSIRSSHIAVVLVLTLLPAVALPAAGFDQTVQDIQQALTDLGYDPGPVDGEMGSKTRTAIEQMQASEGLSITSDMDAVLSQVRDLETALAAGTRTLPVKVNIQRASGFVTAASADFSLYVSTNSHAALIQDGESGRLLHVLQGHTGNLDDADITADGKLVATASDDDTVRLWDSETGRQLRVLQPDKSADDNGYAAEAVEFTPDGEKLLVSSARGLLTAFDVRTGNELFQMRSPDPSDIVSELTISADGTTVVWSSGGAVAVGDIGTGERLRTFSTGGEWLTSPTLTPDGSRLVTILAKERPGDSWNNDSFLVVYDLTGREIESFALDELAYGLIVSPDGAEMMVGNGAANVLRYRFGSNNPQAIPVTAGTMLHAYGEHGEVYVQYDRLRAIDISQPLPIHDFDKSAIWVERLEFAGDETLSLLASKGRAELDIATGQAGSIELTNTDQFSSDGSYLADLSAGGARSLYVKDNSVSVYEGRDDGRLLQTVTHRDVDFLSEAVLSRDGRYMATLDSDDHLIVWDVDTGDQLTSFVTGGDDGLAFSPDGNSIAVGGYELVNIYDWRTGQRRQQLSAPSIPDGLTFSADGAMLAAGGYETGVSAWDLRSGRRLWDGAEAGSIRHVAFSADASLVASSGWGGRFALRNTRTGELILAIPAIESIQAFAMSPDATRVAMATSAGISIFDMASGERLSTSVFFNSGDWVTMTPEGFFASSENGADFMTAARGYEAFSIDQFYNALYRPDVVQAKLSGANAQLVVDAAAQLDLTTVVESGGAPDIAVISPAQGTAFDNDSVEVVVDLADQGGGIGRVEWRVNGITLGVETRGFDRLAIDEQIAAAEPVRLSRTLSLDPGENTIEILAYNAEGLVASEPAQLNVTWTGNEATTPPRLYVLAAGINDYYDSRLQLTYATSDARAIAAAFETAGEGLYESVEITTVLDAEVTAEKLDTVFADLGSRVRPRDVFILFMAGHGKTQDGRYYFLPQDFRYVDETSVASGGIDQDRFQEWLARIPARKSLLLYDTCESGSLTGEVATRGLEEVAALSRMTRAMGRTVLSASTDDAPALEGYRGHGVFTYAVLQALGEGDSNSDGTIEVTELAGAIDRAVPAISHAAFNLRQVPQMSIVGSDFPVATKVAVLDGTSEGASAVPTEPSHVVVAATPIQAAIGGAASVSELSPGELVVVIGTEADQALVGQGGRELGFVPLSALLELR